MMRILAIFLSFYLLSNAYGLEQEEELCVEDLCKLRTLDISNKESVEKATHTLIDFVFIKDYAQWRTHHRAGSLRTYLAEMLTQEYKKIDPCLKSIFETLQANALSLREPELGKLSEDLTQAIREQLGVVSWEP